MSRQHLAVAGGFLKYPSEQNNGMLIIAASSGDTKLSGEKIKAELVPCG